jgi:CRP-like cAMP-binding protein
VSRALEEALAALFRRKQQRVREDVTNLSPGAFRAIVGERLANLAQQLDELKGRVNGLLFLVAGTVLTQVIIRLLG